MTAADQEPTVRKPTAVLRAVSVVTLCGIVALMATAVWHMLFTLMMGLVLVNTGRWGFADFSYLIGLGLLSVLLLCHAALPDLARLPRSVIVSSSIIGVPGVLISLGKWWLLILGSNADWKVVSTFAMFALGVLPFTLVLATGIVLLRADDEEHVHPRRFRIGGVSIAVAAAGVVILLAAWLPRLVRLYEIGAG